MASQEMIIREMAVRELLEQNIPIVEKVITEICNTARKNLPSSAQLNHFKNYVMNRNMGQIKAYLEKRSEVSGSDKWDRRCYSDPDNGTSREKDLLSLSDLLIKKIIDPLKTVPDDGLSEDSDLWGIDFYKFFYDVKLSPPLKIDGHEEKMVRDILHRIIDMLLKAERFEISGHGDSGIRVSQGKKPRDSDGGISDISALIAEEIKSGRRTLLASPKLVIPIRTEEEDGQIYYVAEESNLDIRIFAPDREMLPDELFEQIFFMWDIYALGKPEQLTDDARELGEMLRERFREII